MTTGSGDVQATPPAEEPKLPAHPAGQPQEGPLGDALGTSNPQPPATEPSPQPTPPAEKPPVQNSRDRRPRTDLTDNPRPLPTGWPVGSFESYAKAQAAVDMLSDRGDFPVNELTIVGVNLMEVERVVGRLTWGRILMGGAASGAWMGVFFGLLIGLFSEDWLAPLLVGIVMGLFFGMVGAAVQYASTKGRRDFSSTTQIVAGRYDILCTPEHAPRARDLIAKFNMGGAR